MSERLQKILAAAGIASRRKAEELITSGHVSINGHTVTELGTRADARMDEIRVDGKLLRGPERHVYFMVYKPKGYVTTVSDPEGRPTVMDLLKGIDERVFPVGRLDYMSEGLLLVTNDGDLMAQLTKAGSHVPKTYMVKVSGHPTEEQINKLREGVMLPPEPGMTGVRGKKQPGVERRSFAVRTQPAQIRLAVDQENPWYEVTLTEGRNRQIRRMFEQIEHHIEKIKRVRYGSLELDVEPGQWRPLSPREVNQLRKSLETPFRPKPVRKSEEGAAERPARRQRVDTAKFVKGRRGKASEEQLKAQSERRPRRDEGERRPPRADGERREFKPRRDDGESRGFRPRRDDGESKPFRDRGDRFGSREGGERRPFQRRDREDRGSEREDRSGTRVWRDADLQARADAEREERSNKRREGGFTRPRGPEFRRESRGGTDTRREGGFNRGERPEGPRREGGFGSRERSERPRREGGFPGGARSERPRREGGFRGEGRPERPRREGGFGGRSERPRREGGFEGRERPRREGGFDRGARPELPRREGGFGERGERPRREGSFRGGERSERPRREGGPSRGGERSGARGGAGFGGGRGGSRPGGTSRFGKPSGERRSGGGFGGRKERPEGRGGAGRKGFGGPRRRRDEE